MKINKKPIVTGVFGFVVGFSVALGATSQIGADLGAEFFRPDEQTGEKALLIKDIQRDSNGENFHKSAGRRPKMKKYNNVRNRVPEILKRCKEEGTTDLQACAKEHLHKAKQENENEEDQENTHFLQRDAVGNIISGARNVISNKRQKFFHFQNEGKEENLKKNEILKERMKKQQEIFKECRKKNETQEDLNICLREETQKGQPEEEKIGFFQDSENSFQRPPASPSVHHAKRSLRKMIRTCLQEDTSNLKKCLRNALLHNDSEEENTPLKTPEETPPSEEENN